MHKATEIISSHYLVDVHWNLHSSGKEPVHKLRTRSDYCARHKVRTKMSDKRLEFSDAKRYRRPETTAWPFCSGTQAQSRGEGGFWV